MSETEGKAGESMDEKEQGAGPNQTVLIAIDESNRAEDAFDFYVNNIHRPTNRVILFHAAEAPSVASANMYLSADLWDEILRQEHARSKGIEEKFTEKLKNSCISAKIKTAFYAKPGESIVDQAAKEKATLVVLGTRGMGTIRRTVLGSVSDFVLHHVHCPVLICRH